MQDQAEVIERGRVRRIGMQAPPVAFGGGGQVPRGAAGIAQVLERFGLGLQGL